MSVAIDTQINFDFKNETITWQMCVAKKNTTDLNGDLTISCSHNIFKNRFSSNSINCKSLRNLLMDVKINDSDYVFFYLLEHSVVNSLWNAKNVHNTTYHINITTSQTAYRQAC